MGKNVTFVCTKNSIYDMFSFLFSIKYVEEQ